MAEAEVGLRASLKDRVATSRGLHQLKGDVDQVGRSAETAGTRARIGARGFETMRKAGHLAGMAIKVGFAAALGVGFAAVKLLHSSFAEAREAQKVGARTNNVIKSTGGIAHVTAKQIGALSTAISKKAGIDDEAIQTGENLLLTFKNIRNEAGAGNDIFNQSTKAAIDLSAAGFGSIESASKMMGKALNDPVKGLTAMGRAGVTFSASQTEMIKKLVDQNDLLGAQKIILGEVTSQVGGAAAAQATWGDKAKVVFDNLKERLGRSLLPLLDSVEKWFVQKGSKALGHYLGLFEHRGIPALKGFADRMRPLIETYLPKLQSGIGDVVTSIRNHLPGAAAKIKTTAHAVKTIADATSRLSTPLVKILDAFNKLPSWAKSAIGISVGAGAIASRLKIPDILGSRKLGGSGLLGAVTKAKPLPVWVVNSDIPLPGGGGKTSWIRKALGLGEKAAPLATGAVAVSAPVVAAATLAAAAATGLEAYGLGRLLASADPASDPARNAAYRKKLAAWQSAGSPQGSVRIQSFDPLTGLPSITLLHQTTSAVSAFSGSVTKAAGFVRQLNGRGVSDSTGLYGTAKVLHDIGVTKVAPSITTPGLSKAQASMDTYKATLMAAGQPVRTRISVDIGAAESTLAHFSSQVSAALQGFGGLGGAVATPSTPHHSNSSGQQAGQRSGARHRTLPGYQDDRSTSTAPSLKFQILLDGRELTHSTIRHLKGELANR